MILLIIELFVEIYSVILMQIHRKYFCHIYLFFMDYYSKNNILAVKNKVELICYIYHSIDI